MGTRPRLNFIVDNPSRLLIVRPIGSLTAIEFVEQLYESYAGLSEPWIYRRVTDLRRWDCEFDPISQAEMVHRWSGLTQGITYQTLVATVAQDAGDRLRIAGPSPHLPHETACVFTDYHEAVGWLLASDPAAYLAGLGEVPFRQRQAPFLELE